MINKVYYHLKPLIPWVVRTALRRKLADYRRGKLADIWPIDPRSATTPPGWPGWPEGKKFSVILTHDVEGTKGYNRIPQLVDIEKKLGFRSAFNFVPEREYRLTEELRRSLVEDGFEIGVHGLKHDGKLYSSKEEFAARAVKIRKYLKDWDSVGFRSPLMHHRLGWIHQLGLEYDCSTFDTDPFEPEPDGMSTIFPFWVPNPDGAGYVELPYTLPQDFGLFIILQEPNIDIWKKKLDWIAEKGGMALLNAHPDYMCFKGERAADEFPVAFYEEFLQYARDKYEGQFWTGLPKEISRYYRESIPEESRNTRRKVCMLAYSHYEYDNRVRRYADTLAKQGDRVDVIALCGGDTNLGIQENGGVTSHLIQRRDQSERSMWAYGARLLRFLFVGGRYISKRNELLRYDFIHVHNMPDFLVFAAWQPKWTGAKLILDIHDIVPELFSNKFKTMLPSSWYVSLLKRVEKASVDFVDHVIISNHLWYDTLTSRSAPKEKCSVFINNVDTAVFYPRDRTRTDDRFIVIFPGSFQWHQGLDIAIEAFAKVKDKVPEAEFHIYGGGTEKEDLVRLASKLGLNGSVKFCGSARLEKIPEIIANADLGVVPKRADSFGNEAYSTKIMEFMSQGIPVVVSKTKIDSYYFDEKVVRFFPSGDSGAMAMAMMEVINNQELRKTLIANGYKYAKENSWDERRKEYLDLVDRLLVERFPN